MAKISVKLLQGKRKREGERERESVSIHPMYLKQQLCIISFADSNVFSVT